VKFGILVPTFIELTCHWYAGNIPPFTGFAVNETEVPEQTGFASADMEMVTGRLGLIVITTILLVAGLPEVQVRSEVRTQETASLLDGAYVNADESGPMLIPFTFHWQVGKAPPLTGAAINVTGVPAQTGLADSATETLTGKLGLTVIITVVLVAGFPVVHDKSEEIIQETASLLDGVYVNNGEFDP